MKTSPVTGCSVLRIRSDGSIVPGSVRVLVSGGGDPGPVVVDYEMGTVTFGTFDEALRARARRIRLAAPRIYGRQKDPE